MARRERASIAVVTRKPQAASFTNLRESAAPSLTPSSWLTALPLKEHGFHLWKQDFRDGVSLRYDWPLQEVPASRACGVPFSTVHAMCCPRGGFPTIRHNEVRDFIADWLSEVCPNVAVEPWVGVVWPPGTWLPGRPSSDLPPPLAGIARAASWVGLFRIGIVTGCLARVERREPRVWRLFGGGS